MELTDFHDAATPVPCVKCQRSRDTIMITSCFHIYCKQCMLKVVMEGLACNVSRITITEFQEYRRIDLVDRQGKAKDDRVSTALGLLRNALPNGCETIGKAGHESSSVCSKRKVSSPLASVVESHQDVRKKVRKVGPATDYEASTEATQKQCDQASTEGTQKQCDQDSTLKSINIQLPEQHDHLAERERELVRIEKRLAILEASLVKQAAHPASENPTYMRTHDRTLGERIKGLCQFTDNDNVKILAALQGGAAHLHAQAQNEYERKLEFVQIQVDKELKDMWQQIPKVQAHGDDGQRKSTKTSRTIEKDQKALREVKKRLERLEKRDTTEAENVSPNFATHYKGINISELQQRVLTKQCDELKKENAKLIEGAAKVQKENNRLSDSMIKVCAELAEHRELFKNIVGILSLVGDKKK